MSAILDWLPAEEVHRGNYGLARILKKRELTERKVLRKIRIESLPSAGEVHRGNYGLAVILKMRKETHRKKSFT